MENKAGEDKYYLALCFVIASFCMYLLLKSAIGVDFTTLIFGDIGQQRSELNVPKVEEKSKLQDKEIPTETVTTPEENNSITPQNGNVYQYTDAKGVATYTDNPLSVPNEKVSTVKVRDWTNSQKSGQPAAATKIIDSGNNNTSQVSIIGDQIIVPVLLYNNGKYVECSLLLDTGATHITVSNNIANKLNIDMARTSQMTTTLSDGRQRNSYSAIINGASVGAKAVKNISINIMESNVSKQRYDGLLGMNFLKNFKYHVDFDRQAINWF